MFCDLVDSTGIAAKLDAEEWRDLVGAYLDAAGASVLESVGAWEAIERYRPRVMIVEYNSAIDPRRQLVQPDEPDRYWENNVVGTMRVLDAMHKHGVGRLIFSSTGTVHGNTQQNPITETAEIAPLNPYAASKAAVDLMLPGYCRARGLSATSLRYFNAAGALLRSGGRSCGERHDPESHLIPIVLQVAAGERAAVPLYGDDYDTPDGTGVRDYIHVSDLASAHLLAELAG